MVGFTRDWDDQHATALTRDIAFNRLSKDGGKHVSPFNNGTINVGTDDIVVRLRQGIHEDDLHSVLSAASLATIGIDPDNPPNPEHWQEMFKGGLQTALESQIIVFDVFRVSRTATHQIVRSRRAAFHQQSQRASYMGDQPDVRIPESVWLNEEARMAFIELVVKSWETYQKLCELDISFQDARFALLEGTVTYIMCEYSIKEFRDLYAYRACSMFQWEIAHTVREMKRVLVAAHPWIEPYIKISCQDGPICSECGGAGGYQTEGDIGNGTFDSGISYMTCTQCGGAGRMGTKCTFQGWERVEEQCPFPWAKEDLRVYKPDPSLRIG